MWLGHPSVARPQMNHERLIAAAIWYGGFILTTIVLGYLVDRTGRYIQRRRHRVSH